MFSLKVYILVKYKKLILNKIFLEVQTQSLSRFTKKKSLPRKQKSNTGDVWRLEKKRGIFHAACSCSPFVYPSLPINKPLFLLFIISCKPNTFLKVEFPSTLVPMKFPLLLISFLLASLITFYCFIPTSGTPHSNEERDIHSALHHRPASRSLLSLPP